MPKKGSFSDINPLKRAGKRSGKQDDWNRQQRKTSIEIPDWTKEFQGADWIATPNPEALAPKKQRKARIVLGCILVSLPLSFLSCMFSLGAFTASNTEPPEPVIDTTPDVSPEQYRTRAVAEIEARRWLKASNLQFTALAWQDHRDSSIDCYTATEVSTAGQPDSVNKPCEIHTFFGAVDHEQAIRVEITINPDDNEVRGHYIESRPLPVQQLPEEWGQGSLKVTEDILAVLPDGFRQTITEFIQAWTTNDQDALRLIAGEVTVTKGELEEIVEQNAFGLQGWRIEGTAGSSAEDSAEDAANLNLIQLIEERVEKPENFGGQHYLTTVAFSLVQECVEESEVNNLSIPTTGDETDTDDLFVPPSCKSCVTTTPVEQAEQRGTCDGQLDITLDLIVAVDGLIITVIRSGPVGSFDEETPYQTLGRTQNSAQEGG